MSGSHEDSPAAERDLQETRDELTQASIALNTAYDRLQDLRASLRNVGTQGDRLSNMRSHQQARLRSAELMGPDHSAIVLSDSDEESEVDMEDLRDTLPSRLLELTSRWGHQHARLNAAARQMATAESSNASSSPSSTSFLSEEPRPIYPPFRRRRPQPPAGPSSRDGGVVAPLSATSPARRSIVEAQLRHLRYASNPGESSTTLGRRVTQRAAAAAQIAARNRHATGTGRPASSDTIVHSTLPLGLEPRGSPSSSSLGSTTPRSIESRAATHLRHSLLPNPPSGIRPATGPTGGTYTRFNDRAEIRPRTARSNSLTALTRIPSTTPNAAQQGTSHEAPTEVPLSSRLGQLRASHSPLSEEAMRLNFVDPSHASYRVRRHVNAQGEEQVFNINWSELMSDADRDDELSDPAAWMRQPRRQLLPYGSRPSRAQPEPDTDDTIVHDAPPASSRESRPISREGGVQRRRGWARLDPDGDEISTEDEASFERTRTELRLPRPRNWGRNGTAWAAGRGSTVAVLDFVHHNSRDATTEQHESNSPLEGEQADRVASPLDERTSSHILDDLFRPEDTGYINPLPVHFQSKGAQSRVSQQYPKEVRVTIDSRMAGR